MYRRVQQTYSCIWSKSLGEHRSRVGSKIQLVYNSTNVRLNNVCNVCRCCLSAFNCMQDVHCTNYINDMQLLTNKQWLYFLYTICIPPVMLAI